MRHRYLGIGCLLAALGLAAGCAGPTQTRIMSEPSYGHDIPIDAPVEFVDRSQDGPRINRFGGEIPYASPSRPVDEAGIDEPRPG